MSDFILNQAMDSTDNSRKRKRGRGIMESGFRLDAIQIFLTYSQCPLDPNFILDNISKVYPIKYYIIAQELHQDGNKHIHCYLKLEKKANFRDNRKYDIVVDNTTYHPKIEGCRSPKSVIKYVTKDGNYLTNMSNTSIDEMVEDKVKVKELYKQARTEASNGDLEKAFLTLSNPKCARDLTLYGPTIEKNLHALIPKTNNILYDISKFTVPFTWDKSKTLIIHGTTNCGKSSLASALLPKALFVRHMDRLRDYNSGNYEGIIFDDMSFKHIPRDGQIHLVDTAFDSDIHIRYGTAFIPKGTPRIITTNLSPENCLLAIDPAIARRIQCEEIIYPLFEANRQADEHSDHSNDEFELANVLNLINDDD